MKTLSLSFGHFGWALLVLLAFQVQAAQEPIGPGRYRFSVLAGAPGAKGYLDGVGTAARFDNPGGIAVDASGNVYVSEANAGTIRKISPEGIVTTWAGAPGQPGSSDGTGPSARFNTPTDLAVDRAGNVYVADTGNHTIRRINASGQVTTLAGTPGEPGYINGTRQVARLNGPRSIAVDDSGNVFFADTHGEFGAERPIRKVAPDGVVSNLPLSGKPQVFDFNIQQWVRVDRAGHVYVMILHSGPFNDLVDVEKLTPSPDGKTYVPTTIFTDIIWEELTRIDLDGNGNLFIKDADGPLLVYSSGGDWQTPRYLPGRSDTLYEFAVGKTGQIYFIGGMLRGGALEVGVFDPAARGPVLRTQPSDRWTRPGDTVEFGVDAVGGAELSFQWYLNSTPLPGATGSVFSVSNVQARDVGYYSVVVTDEAASVTSRSAGLFTGPAPSITREPTGATVALGSTAVFNVSASDATSYQWHRGGQPISGATNPTLVIRGAQNADLGHYWVWIGSAAGLLRSREASLALSIDPNFGHLTNLSVRTRITASDPSFTVGTVIGGGRAGLKPLLVRAVGPSLAALNVATPLADAKLEIRAGGVVIAENNDWGGDPVLRNVAVAVGAFPLVAENSKDAAVFGSQFVARDYTISVSGVNGATGDVLAELYDSSAFFNGSIVPRLINVSVLRRIDGADSLTAGFVIGGSTGRTVLVRAIGPGLGALNVPAAMADPQLALFDAAQTKIAENDNWGGDVQLSAASAEVGAFGISDRSSKDAMLLVTLAPGSYTAQVIGKGAGGSVLVEVYEVP